MADYSQKKYDVFISFRGEDTRANFTSHLHKKLKDGGIETYIDEDKLKRGEKISNALLEAIKDSKISIVVFSKDYASSSWCLSELKHILRCVKRKTHIVVPVFYQVDPSDVRKQIGSYAEAFKEHEDRYNDATIRRWKDALTKAANHSGWDVSKSSNEAVVVHEIFNWILEKLRSISPSPHYSKQGIFGIDNSIADLNNLLSNSARIGICGMGGLGKTTLAQIVFNQSRHQYDCHCFFRNVREEFQKHGTNLKEEFFRQLSNEKDLRYGHLDSVKERLRHKKLLIVLDAVDDLEEYNCLLEDSDSWLNSESKLIITSRNHQVLRNIIGNDERMIYNLKGLKEKEALELFCLHAFKRRSPEESEKELSLKFVKYAQGLPLALKVLGSLLFSKNKDVWESLLNNIKVDPDQKVTSKLKISFDGLDSKQQSIFLDIACFFRGRKKYYVKEILDDCGDFDIAIEVLIDRCLVTVSDKGTLEMHDLLREMGRSIARGSNHNKCLENYSRLWMGEDICRFLTSNKASSTIEGIFHADRDDGDVINLDPSIFKNLPSLRLLKLSSIYSRNRFRLPFHGLRDKFPDELRYLEWYEYPLKSLGSNFTPQNLVYFSMERSKLKKLWKENQDVSNLKHVILSESKKLTCLPNLSQANLHTLRLNGCTRLVNLPPLRFHNIFDDPDKESEVMYQYNSLMVQEREYTLDSCKGIMKEGISYLMRELSTSLLDLNGCSNFTTLSEISGNIKFICLRETAIKKCHPSILYLKNLLVLDLHMCKYLRELPNDMCELESLEYLDMHGCVSFDKFPRLPKSIKGLNLNGTSIQQVDSSSFDSLPSLIIFHMQACKKLKRLPDTFCKLKSLWVLQLEGCSQLKSFPEILEPMEKLKGLYLKGTGIKEMPSSIENLVGLETLDLRECKNLKCIPTTICKLKSLKFLDLRDCSQLKSFPEVVKPMLKLEELWLDGTGIEEIPSSINHLIVLERLYLGDCKNLKSIDTNIFNMRKIACIKIDEDPKLQILPYNGLPVEDSSETSTSQLLLTHDQPYICSSCTSTSILNLHYHGVYFTCCQCFLFYTMHNISATQYFMDNIFIGKCRDGKGKDLIEAIRTSFCYPGDTIAKWFDYQSMGSLLVLNFPFLLDDYNVLGFALCIVVEFEATTLKREDVFKCDYNLKTKTGQNFQLSSTLQCYKATHFDDDSNLDLSSNQVFMWYDHGKDFLLDGKESVIFEFYIGTGRIKQCGVHLVHPKNINPYDYFS
ncbi:disease resistance protein RPV1-like [Cannabis sativa]|uniref:disease resistance protein RPV1-like n=1 Tax=Cannabis sativa TaxID=3483 RepID=UPI0029C9EDA3|nr:disease resistance protein RPV1-like [Cannabis sativa]